MTNVSKQAWCVLSLLAAMASVQTVVVAQTVVVPVPRVEGPVAVTSASRPFMGLDHAFQPIDLAPLGYVEEEFFVSGTANVYDWAPTGTVSVRTPDAPYTTRVLVRRPVDPARFSGNVVVEILHAPRGHDWALMWGWSHDHFLEHGDAWVGVTMVGAAAQALQRFDPDRYASISFANPTPTESCAPGGNGPNANTPVTSEVEDGLRWDMISQVGALLKSDVPARPLAGFNVEHVYQTTQDPAQLTYINAIHARARLAGDRPVYDGYLVKSGRVPTRIRRCSDAIANGDPRQAPSNIDVPVINLQMEGDVLNALGARRPDSDEPGDLFRLYEIAGVAHFDSSPFRGGGVPSVADMRAVGGSVVTIDTPVAGYQLAVPFRREMQCDPPVLTEQPVLGYLFNGAFANLDRWVRTGTPSPRGDRLDVRDVGTSQASFVVDEFGHTTGGVRTPYVDVPTATYSVHHTGPAGAPCRQYGYRAPFDWARLESVYGGYTGYKRQAEESVDRFVRDGWVSESDGQRIRAELMAITPPPAPTSSQ
jgi:hypothetical protein